MESHFTFEKPELLHNLLSCFSAATSSHAPLPLPCSSDICPSVSPMGSFFSASTHTLPFFLCSFSSILHTQKFLFPLALTLNVIFQSGLFWLSNLKWSPPSSSPQIFFCFLFHLSQFPIIYLLVFLCVVRILHWMISSMVVGTMPVCLPLFIHCLEFCLVLSRCSVNNHWMDFE